MWWFRICVVFCFAASAQSSFKIAFSVALNALCSAARACLTWMSDTSLFAIRFLAISWMTLTGVPGILAFLAKNSSSILSKWPLALLPATDLTASSINFLLSMLIPLSRATLNAASPSINLLMFLAFLIWVIMSKPDLNPNISAISSWWTPPLLVCIFLPAGNLPRMSEPNVAFKALASSWRCSTPFNGSLDTMSSPVRKKCITL